MPASIAAWNAWAASNNDGSEKGKVAALIKLARTAIGNNTLEEQLIRLMVWVGATLQHKLEPATGDTPLEFLMQRCGWCDQQCKTFGFLAQHILNIETRLVRAPHTDGQNSHVMIEARYADSWHLFDIDPMHQVVYRHPDTREILSWETLHDNRGPVIALEHWWMSPVNGMGRVGFFETCEYYPINWSWPWPTKPKK